MNLCCLVEPRCRYNFRTFFYFLLLALDSWLQNLTPRICHCDADLQEVELKVISNGAWELCCHALGSNFGLVGIESELWCCKTRKKKLTSSRNSLDSPPSSWPSSSSPNKFTKVMESLPFRICDSARWSAWKPLSSMHFRLICTFVSILQNLWSDKPTGLQVTRKNQSNWNNGVHCLYEP